MRAGALTLAGVVALVAATALLSACGDRANEGDCVVRIRYDGDIYRPHSVMLTPRRGESLGVADRVDCDGESLPGESREEVFAVAGVDPSALVMTHEAGGEGVYINTGVPYRERPAILKEGSRFLECNGPASFTGSWGYIDPEDVPGFEDYDTAEVPYTGVFTSRRGRGLALDRWSQITLEAEITAATDPVPSPEFLEKVLVGNDPVVVTTRCRGKGFEVTSIRLATPGE